MHSTFITEVRGQWVVTLEQQGRRQEYICETLTLARRWALLLGAPIRQHHQSNVKAQPVV